MSGGSGLRACSRLISHESPRSSVGWLDPIPLFSGSRSGGTERARPGLHHRARGIVELLALLRNAPAVKEAEQLCGVGPCHLAADITAG